MQDRQVLNRTAPGAQQAPAGLSLLLALGLALLAAFAAEEAPAAEPPAARQIVAVAGLRG